MPHLFMPLAQRVPIGHTQERPNKGENRQSQSQAENSRTYNFAPSFCCVLNSEHLPPVPFCFSRLLPLHNQVVHMGDSGDLFPQV